MYLCGQLDFMAKSLIVRSLFSIIASVNVQCLDEPDGFYCFTNWPYHFLIIYKREKIYSWPQCCGRSFVLREYSALEAM